MIIGVCGVIGSGKSVVSRILRLKGCQVYDCDREAKRIMAESGEIKDQIRDKISSSVTDGISAPDKKILADIIFRDDDKRKILNSIVHSAVRHDVESEHLKLTAGGSSDILWVEAAIMAESGLAGMCDEIWEVRSPVNVRLKNILLRDKSGEEEARRRINSQKDEERLLEEYREKIKVIYNDSSHSLLEQVEDRLKILNYA